MTFNERLKLICEFFNYTQSDIARKCELSKTKVSRIFNNKTIPTIKDIEKIAEGLELPIATLVEENILVDNLLITYHMFITVETSDDKVVSYFE